MGVTMEVPKDAVLLRVFIGEDDKSGRKPLYEAIVLKAREMHLAGATVLRGPMGFGHSSRIHTTKILRCPKTYRSSSRSSTRRRRSRHFSRRWTA